MHAYKPLTLSIMTLLSVALLAALPASALSLSRAQEAELEALVMDSAQTLMREHSIPGMAFGITAHGRHYIFCYGVADKNSGQRVSPETLFELGSVSKIFTGTLGAYAQELGRLRLADNASSHFPALSGTAFDRISLLSLATYTPGGLPLQFPDAVGTSQEMLAYFRNWHPQYPMGTQRTYSNPSIGLFGHITAAAMNRSFENLMQHTLFPALGLARTCITVPNAEMPRYAQGYTRDGTATRVAPGMLDAEAYGVKSCMTDMLRFMALHTDGTPLDRTWQRALRTTQRGVYSVGAMTQGLGWEMYAWPPDVDAMAAGFDALVLEPQPVTPPRPPQPDMLLHKTGSTRGFGAYVACIPSRQVGIVILANKNYPNAARIRTGMRILEVFTR